MEPTERKPTHPGPVYAPPPKVDSSTVGEVIEELILLNSNFSKNKSASLEEGGEKKRSMENEKSVDPSLHKKLKANELEQDLHLSEDEAKKTEESSEKVQWKMTEITKSPIKKKTLKIKNYPMAKEYKSKEFISEGEDSDEEPSKSNDVRKQLKFTSPKPLKNTRQCRYFFKNHPRKGERCDQRSRDEYCATHKKVMSAQPNSFKPVAHSDGSEYSNKKSQETIKKLENEVESLKRIIMDSQAKIQEMDAKINHLMGKIKTDSPTEVKKLKKIQKLNRERVYRLISYNEGEGIFKDGGDSFKMKIPSGMSRPQIGENLQLKFNNETSKFEWMKVA